MNSSVRSCSQITNDYINFLSGNYLSYDDMYQNMIQSERSSNSNEESYNYRNNDVDNNEEASMDNYMNNQLSEEDMMEEECMYLKNMYPKSCLSIVKAVDEECDKLEYEGSLMFDEYPDRIRLEQITHHIYNLVNKDSIENTVEINEYCRGRYCRNNRCYDCYEDGNPNWLYTLVKAMFYNELLHRRRRYRYRRYRR